MGKSTIMMPMTTTGDDEDYANYDYANYGDYANYDDYDHDDNDDLREEEAESRSEAGFASRLKVAANLNPSSSSSS